MSKNNVGSLYYEILLNPDSYKKGAAKIRKEQSELSSFLKSDSKEVLSEREKARLEAEKLARANWNANKNDAKRRSAIQKAIVRAYKRRIKEIEAAESTARVQSVLQERRRMEDRRRAVARGMERIIAEERRAERRRLSLQGGMNGGPVDNPLGGLGRLWEGFTGIAGRIGTVTMAIWPLTQAFNFLSRSVGSVVNVFMQWMKLIDDFKMSVKNMALQMDGNVKAAKDLASSIEQYAAKTSLSVQAGLDMANSLLVMGVNADFVMIRLKQFNKVAQGNAHKFKRIAKAYTDVIAAGTLKTTELNQFTEVHVPLREFLRKVLEEEGRFTGNLSQMISDRLVTARDVSKALDRIGEKYKDADLFGLETVSGQLENIIEEITIFFRHADAAVKANQDLVEILKSVGRLLPYSLEAFKELMSLGKGMGMNPFENLRFVLAEIERQLKLIMMLRSYLATGDMHAWQKELDLFNKITEQNAKNAEKEARARAEQADAMVAAENARLAAAERYVAIMEELRVKDESAQGKYDQWAKENNIGEFDKMGQFELNMAYMAQQQAEAQKRYQEEADRIAESRADREASKLEKALSASLPQSAFKKNSVEEFRYLQQQRKQAERDKREQERFDQKVQQDQDNADRQYTATLNFVATTDATTSI